MGEREELNKLTKESSAQRLRFIGILDQVCLNLRIKRL